MSDNPVFDRITAEIAEATVVLFMKGTPDFPQCGFSGRSVQILQACGVETFGNADVLMDTELRDGIKVFSNWPTIPQLFVKGELIGGCDIVMELESNGKLKDILDSAGT